MIDNNPFTCLPNYITSMNSATLAYPLCLPGDLVNNPNGCSNFSVGINKLAIENEFTISPNPFTSLTTITFSEEQKNTTLKVTDVLGNLIQQSSISNQKATLVDMSSFAKGIYFVRIEDKKKNVVNRKIVLQ